MTALDLTARLAEALKGHGYSIEAALHGRMEVLTIVCVCGNRYGLGSSHYAHQAEQLAVVVREAQAVAHRDTLESVRPLIQDLTGNDDDPCQFDHHGGCQAHGYLTLEAGELCPQEAAKRWLRARADNQEKPCQ